MSTFNRKSFNSKHPGLHRLGSIFLLLALLTSIAPDSFARIYNQQTSPQDFTATCTDDNGTDATGPAGSMHKIPLASLDAFIPDMPQRIFSLSSGYAFSDCAPDIPDRLSMHLVYTQVTSSAF